MKKSQLFISTNAKFYKEGALLPLKDKLESFSDDQMLYLNSMNPKDPTIALIISIFVGSLGIDRFFIGDTGLGIAKLLTLGGCGVWTIVDWFLIMNRTRDKNLERLHEIVYQAS
ncbi:MAG TPA: TM2 domain-containing protein [Pseudogracilibacillus sp.]|nr:TM2 domain-containing protein [Pseudogracilibacillus sp.]